MNNIGHIPAPAGRPFSNGLRGQSAVDFVKRAKQEICHELGVSDKQFLKDRGRAAMTARHRACVIAMEILSPSLGLNLAAEALGLRHSTMVTCCNIWKKYEGAE